MAISLTDAYAYGALVADGWYGCHARPLAARVARGAKNCRMPISLRRHMSLHENGYRLKSWSADTGTGPTSFRIFLKR